MTIKLHGPFTVELKTYFTNGEQTAIITSSLGRGKIATSERISKAMQKAEQHIKSQLGDDWRLCNKQEYFNEITQEMTGSDEEFACPGSPEWDAFPSSQEANCD